MVAFRSPSLHLFSRDERRPHRARGPSPVQRGKSLAGLRGRNPPSAHDGAPRLPPIPLPFPNIRPVSSTGGGHPNTFLAILFPPETDP